MKRDIGLLVTLPGLLDTVLSEAASQQGEKKKKKEEEENLVTQVSHRI